MILFGLVAAVNGPKYHVGTLMHMGPGFMPTALGVLLIILGVAIAGTASVGATDGDEVDSGHLLPEHPQWFAWLCILAGPLMFVIFGTIGGMAPATFACVFVSALGDRTVDLEERVHSGDRDHGVRACCCSTTCCKSRCRSSSGALVASDGNRPPRISGTASASRSSRTT